MSLKTETVTYGSEQYTAYFAVPARAKAPLPAVVVLQEAWGLDDHIEDVTRRFALAGYAAIAPDLYSVRGVRPAPLARDRTADFLDFINEAGPAFFADEKARAEALGKVAADRAARLKETMGALFGGRDLAKHVPALLATTKYVREDRAETRGQKVGAVGYCMGGALAALLACHDPQLAVVCDYYGTGPSEDLVAKIQCPVFGFYGEVDPHVNPGIPAFAEAMKKHGKRFESHMYAGAQHAFFNDARPSYDAAASRDAFARTLDAFRTHLV